jgi:hypothetical protein
MIGDRLKLIVEHLLMFTLFMSRQNVVIELTREIRMFAP